MHVVLLTSPIKIWGKSVQGFPSYDRTYKQTNKYRLQLYMIRYTECVKFLYETKYVMYNLLNIYQCTIGVKHVPLLQWIYWGWKQLYGSGCVWVRGYKLRYWTRGERCYIYVSKLKDLSLCHKLLFSNPYIYETMITHTLVIQTMNETRSNNLSLKYQVAEI